MANNNILNEIGKIFLIYRFRKIIILGLFILIAIYFIITPNVDKEYQKYGYTGYSDTIKYDQWTGEIIPKSDINTYTSDNKYIINSKGEKISVEKINILLNKYKEIQGEYMSISEDKKDSLDVICNILLRKYLDLEYKIQYFEKTNPKNYRFQIIGEYENNYYSNFSTPSDLKSLVKEVFKDKYNKQNNF